MSGSFHWDDPLLLEEQLTWKRRRWCGRPRGSYAQGRLAPRVVEAFRREHTDPGIFEEMGELGLLGATIPEEFGGGGLNYVSYGLIAREVERVDSGYRSMMSVQSSLVMLPIYRFGTEIRSESTCPHWRAAKPSDASGLTEPNHGSDPGSMITRARATRRRLSSVGRQDLDLQQPHRRCVRRVGQRPTTTSFAALFSEKGWKGLAAPVMHGKVGLRASTTGQFSWMRYSCLRRTCCRASRD